MPSFLYSRARVSGWRRSDGARDEAPLAGGAAAEEAGLHHGTASPLDPVGWASLAGATFAAALLQAASGFGFAILALPLYLIFLDPAHAVQLVIILTTALSVVVLPGLRQAIVPGLLARLLFGTLVGVPIGLLAFRYADPHWIRAVIGIAILGFAGLFLALRGRRWSAGSLFRANRASDLTAGALSGAATAMVGIGGPPVLLYLLFAGVSPLSIRATLLAFFFLSYAAAVVSHGVTVGIPEATWLGAGILFPFVLVGGFLGKRLGDRVGADTFVALALVLLAATAVYTLATAVLPDIR